MITFEETKKWYLKRFPKAVDDFDMTGHDDSFMIKQMNEYANEIARDQVSKAIHEVQDKVRNKGYNLDLAVIMTQKEFR